jgi:hypothetical protein
MPSGNINISLAHLNVLLDNFKVPLAYICIANRVKAPYPPPLPYENFHPLTPNSNIMSFDRHPMNTKPRTLTVQESVRNHPQIVLLGAWLEDWGFAPGDRLTAFNNAPSTLLLRPGTPPIFRSQTQWGQSLAHMKKYRPRPICVFQSIRSVPQIIISGAWLRDWNILIGDRLSVTRTPNSDIITKTDMPAVEWREVRQKRKLELDIAKAKALLRAHKAAHPSLYQEDPKPTRKRKTPVRSLPAVIPVPQSPLEPLLARFREINASMAASIERD